MPLTMPYQPYPRWRGVTTEAGVTQHALSRDGQAAETV